LTYLKTTWENREVEKPRTYTLVNNPDGTVTLTPAEGNIITQGTPIIADNMNNLETQFDESVQYTDAQVLNFLKTYGQNYSIELLQILFFTNGGSTEASGTATYSSAYSVPPIIIPANIVTPVSYSDVIHYPYMYNISTTGCTVKLTSQGNFGTLGSPANMNMNFFAFGQK
jgi:hypothetical protein